MTNLPRTFAALSDDTRLKMVEYLMRHGEKPAGALAELADISAPAISRHLRILREAGVLEQRVAGTHRFYKVRPETMQTISDWTIDHRAFWSAGLDRLDIFLALDPDREDTQ